MTSPNTRPPPSQPIDIENHLSILALLPEFVMQQVLGHQLHPDWQPLKRHLEQCSACSAEYSSLLQQMMETYTGTLPAVSFTPSLPPFLAQRYMQPYSSPPAQAEPAPPPYHIQFSAAIRKQMQVRIVVRSGEMRLLYTRTFPPLQDINPTITLEVFGIDKQSSHATVRICTEFADRDPFDQAGATVTLVAGETNYSAVTDQSGVVIIPDVPLDGIDNWQISVTPPPLDDQPK